MRSSFLIPLLFSALALAACASTTTSGGGGGTSSGTAGGGGSHGVTSIQTTYDWACVSCDCTCAGVHFTLDGDSDSPSSCQAFVGMACNPGDAGEPDGGSDGGAPTYEACTPNGYWGMDGCICTTCP